MADIRQYDVIVLGAGAAGISIARTCNSTGLSVAIIDHRPYGGTCPLRGCEPKKVLADTAKAMAHIRDMRDNGILGDVRVDWPVLQDYTRSFTEPVPGKIEQLLRKEGLALYHDKGVFTGPDSVRTGDALLRGEHICIATGAEPRKLGIPGEERILLSDDFLTLERLPQRIVFVGGGFISFEFAFVAAIAGAETAIVHHGSRVLKRFDPDLVGRLLERARELGISVHLDMPPVEVLEREGELVLAAGEDGKERFATDAVVNGAGRVPAVADLDLDVAGVKHGPGGVRVDGHMRSTTNPRVWAAGDVAEGGVALTPVASREAEVVAHNILHQEQRTMEHGPIPYALFTDPPLASVGLQESEARDRGLDIEILSGDSAKWSEYKRIGRKHAGYKIIADPQERILGAHLLGDGADEVINLFAMAMRHSMTLDDFRDMLWAYPSFGYTIRYMLGL